MSKLRLFKVPVFKFHILPTIADGLHLPPQHQPLPTCPSEPWIQASRPHISCSSMWMYVGVHECVSVLHVCASLWGLICTFLIVWVCLSVCHSVGSLCFLCITFHLLSVTSVCVPTTCVHAHVCVHVHMCLPLSLSTSVEVSVCYVSICVTVCICECTSVFVNIFLCLWVYLNVCLSTWVCVSISMLVGHCLCLSLNLSANLPTSVWPKYVCVGMAVCLSV